MPPSIRSFWIRCCWIFVAIALIGSACGEQQSPETQGPNFVIILTDDQESSSLEHMPHLQELLVDEGTSFGNFFLNDPICCPARGTIFLGEYRHNHRLESHENGCSYRFFEEQKHLRSMGKLLHDAGYRTSYIGKPLNRYDGYLELAGSSDDGDHLLAGWSDYHAIVKIGFYGFDLHENGGIRSVPPDPSQYQTDVLSRLGQQFITKNATADGPFLLFIAPDAPHAPTEPAHRHRDSFPGLQAPRGPSYDEADVSGQPGVENNRRLSFMKVLSIDSRYRRTLQSLLAVDEMVRDLIETLATTGRLEDTYFFYLSDNGLHFGEHRLSSGKGTPYEESVRVPFIVRGPGVGRGRETSRLVTNADLLPTILDLAGLPPRENIDGRSIAPLLRADAEQVPWRTAIPLESRHAARNQSVPPFGAIRTERYKWIEYENDRHALYDLANDPHEMTNVAGGRNAAIGEELSRRLKKLLACAGSSCREAEDAPLSAKVAGE
jgi:N-acetylglucosamine-6-sulfatase